MSGPGLTPGIKEPDDFCGHGIDAGEVGTLVLVVVVTGQRQVGRIITTAVLLRNHMFQVQAVEGLVVLMYSQRWCARSQTRSRVKASIKCARKLSGVCGT